MCGSVGAAPARGLLQSSGCGPGTKARGAPADKGADDAAPAPVRDAKAAPAPSWMFHVDVNKPIDQAFMEHPGGAGH